MKTTSSINHKLTINDEKILVIKRTNLFTNGDWQGIKEIDTYDSFEHIIKQYKEFHSRSIMENDPTYKQIIPYLLFKYQDKYFVMQRKKTASEQRLKSKLSLGIGGHVKEEDLLRSNNLIDWAMREFNEEVTYAGNLAIKPIAIINDDSNEVGKVHIGFILLLEGNSANISIKSELKNGVLESLTYCSEQFDLFEPWSQLLINFLYKRDL